MSKDIKRWIVHTGWLCALMAILCGVTYAQAPNQVALVIQYADGTVSTQCITFQEDEITGLDVLLRAGLDVVSSGGGASVQICKIGADGCATPGNCFCQCKGSECKYWSYWHLVDGAWQYAIFGAGSYAVKPGAVEGWVWGIGTPQDAPKPPLISFDEVCAPATATQTSTPMPTNTPIPTDTPMPTDTAQATDTAAPTGTPASTVASTRLSTPSPTTAPTRAPTRAASATSVPTAGQTPRVTATQATQPTRTTGPAPSVTQRPATGNYVVFGGIVVLLAVVGVFVWQRNRG